MVPDMVPAGFLRHPKWGHLKDLHATIKLCEPALTAVDGSPQYVKLGPMQEVCYLFSRSVLCCLFYVFRENINI